MTFVFFSYMTLASEHPEKNDELTSKRGWLVRCQGDLLREYCKEFLTSMIYPEQMLRGTQLSLVWVRT